MGARPRSWFRKRTDAGGVLARKCSAERQAAPFLFHFFTAVNH